MTKFFVGFSGRHIGKDRDVDVTAVDRTGIEVTEGKNGTFDISLPVLSVGLAGYDAKDQQVVFARNEAGEEVARAEIGKNGKWVVTTPEAVAGTVLKDANATGIGPWKEFAQVTILAEYIAANEEVKAKAKAEREAEKAAAKESVKEAASKGKKSAKVEAPTAEVVEAAMTEASERAEEVAAAEAK